MRSRFSTVVLAALAAVACSRGVVSSDDLPTAPTPQPARAVRLTITPVGGGSLLVGATAPVSTTGGLPSSGARLGAFAEFNNGQSRYIPASWTSSDEGIVAVVANTLVARRSGAATLTATFEGISDTEDFVVERGFFGRWSGTYVIDRCSGTSGSMEDVLCRPAEGGRSGIAPLGAVLPFALDIPETTSVDITGRVSFGQVNAVLSGKNRGGGYFYLAGQVPGAGGIINIIEWDTHAAGDVMEGRLAYQVRLEGLPGTGTVGGRLANMTRQ